MYLKDQRCVVYHDFSFKSIARLGGKNDPTCVVHAVAVHTNTCMNGWLLV